MTEDIPYFPPDEERDEPGWFAPEDNATIEITVELDIHEDTSENSFFMPLSEEACRWLSVFTGPLNNSQL